MLILTNSAHVRLNFRKNSMPQTHGILTQILSLLWMPSAVRRRIRLWMFSREVKDDALHCAAFFCSSPTFFFWTNRPTTWTQKQSHGLSVIFRITREPSSQSLTTATSWTTWPDGFWKWTAEKDTRSREIIPHGLRQRKRDLPRKKNRLQSDRSRCRKSLSGFTPGQRVVRQSTRSTSQNTNSFLPKKANGSPSRIHKSQFPQDPVLEIS